MQKFLIAAAVFVAASAGAAMAQTAAPAHGPGGMFAMADANHDGTVSRAEFDAARAARFAQMDANHDGSLSADEQPHWGPPPGAAPAAGGGEHHGPPSADANGDGIVSRAEYDAQAARMFDRFDANHDGSITQAEIQAAMQH